MHYEVGFGMISIALVAVLRYGQWELILYANCLVDPEVCQMTPQGSAHATSERGALELLTSMSNLIHGDLPSPELASVA